MSHLFPVYLKLDNRKCLVIGGGKVAERKIENLMEYGAQVTVVSPQVDNNIKVLAEHNDIIWHNRIFQEKDLRDIYMVFIATDDTNLNYEVAGLCRQKGILVNAVDDPSNCDFFVPSVIRRNSLAIAISTEGKSPLFARRLRQEMENIITPEYGEFVDILGEQRELVKKNIPDIEERKKVFESLVYSDILELLKMGENEKVREKIEQCMSLWSD